MAWLLDTNVVSELYKRNRQSLSVISWYNSIQPEDLFISVLVVGEIRRGAELMRPKDPIAAASLENWLLNLQASFHDRILPITEEIADLWGRVSLHQKSEVIDGLMAATALHHRLTVVTRNTKDFLRSGAACFNPFLA
jgi:predicted nucleic acid-binding protein